MAYLVSESVSSSNGIKIREIRIVSSKEELSKIIFSKREKLKLQYLKVLCSKDMSQYRIKMCQRKLKWVLNPKSFINFKFDKIYKIGINEDKAPKLIDAEERLAIIEEYVKYCREQDKDEDINDKC